MWVFRTGWGLRWGKPEQNQGLKRDDNLQNCVEIFRVSYFWAKPYHSRCDYMLEVWETSSETKPKGKPGIWNWICDIPCILQGEIFLVLPQQLCSWLSGRPHTKQTNPVKLIIMPFLVVVDLSAEESIDHVSCTCFWKFSRMQVHMHTVHMATASGDGFPRAYIFGLPWRSLMWVLWIFCLHSSQLLKASLLEARKRKQDTGNPLDPTVQRKIVLCCLPLESLIYLSVPPVLCSLSASGPWPPYISWPLSSFPPVRCLTHFSSNSFPSPAEETEGSLKIVMIFFGSSFLISLGEKPPYTWNEYVFFFPHDSYSSSPLSTRVTCTTFCIPQLCPKVNFPSGHEGLSGTLELI